MSYSMIHIKRKPILHSVWLCLCSCYIWDIAMCACYFLYVIFVSRFDWYCLNIHLWGFFQWNIISKGFCCCSNERFFDERNLYQERDVTAHPSNSQIGLSAHAPLYPPGKMIHVVRSHASEKK